MNILLTNDDGFNSEGISNIHSVLQELEDTKVIIIAPEKERSGASHSVTIFEPIVVNKIKENIYALNGTPVDCVKLGLNGFLKDKIDLIISGINSGPNMGFDIFYSGTVGAAREGCFHKVPSIAFSVNSYNNNAKDYSFSSCYALSIIKNVIKEGLPEGIFLNVNLPCANGNKIKGIKITSTGDRVYNNEVVERSSPLGFRYFWLGAEKPSYIQKKESDFDAIEQNYVSVTPLKLDKTAYSFMENLKNWTF